MNITSLTQYKEQYEAHKDDTAWLETCKEYEWFNFPTKALEGNFNDANVTWFNDGKLNITVNALDRHAKNTPNKIAIIWEPNNPEDKEIKITYKELLERVCKFANVLKDQGVKKGDPVCFYMSMIPELLVGALACARIGAIHSIVFGGFSAKALAGRIEDSSVKFVITNDEGPRGDKKIPLKEICDQAISMCSCVEKVLVVRRTFANLDYNEKHIIINDLLEKASSTFEPVVMNSEDPLFILYTSGSTGKPKGLLHTTAGFMVWSNQTFKNVFQAKDNDIFWCSADIGWITGHSYMTYGPLISGATQVMFEGIPTFPDPGRFWNIIDKYKVTHFYTAPTAIRALQACEDRFYKEADLNSLKVLGSVGEPINIEAWNWYHENIGKNKCPIVDTWWQTETGGIMISNLAGVTKAIACHATNPLPGVFPILVDADGNEIKDKKASGNLCISKPWPGMARTIYGDHQRYIDTYLSTYAGNYFTGDGAKRDENGNYRITGRVDDVINVSGHRIGTAEVEDAINKHELIIESAVVGMPHEIKGQGIMAYAISKGSHADIMSQINSHLVEQLGPIAKLDKLVITTGLPKTRSGKIMRRILRKLAAGDKDNLGDISTLVNPQVVEELINKL
ncbi:MAG: acetate--CoA ligase [Bacteriovoracaceae bacterium]|jgi:acetyl-CoA synthetase|nr:acetate--CoA ligase [Bacteriovoracaceae bacterium]